MRALIGSVLVSAIIALPGPAGANVSSAVPALGSAPELCRDAARQAAMRYGIPVEMMLAITLVETRRKVGGVSGPWPWTLNIEGEGFWYDTKGEALARAEREIAAGRRSIDLGCFQLNYRWHGQNFAALDEMLDPALAADYAARFLGELFAETGDWMRAAGLYHSRTPVNARRYRGMIGRALAGLERTLNTAHIATGSPAAPLAAPQMVAKPGPRSAGSTRAKPIRKNPLYAIVLATALTGARKDARLDARTNAHTVRDPAIAAAPGAVILRMFARPAGPLLAIRGLKP